MSPRLQPRISINKLGEYLVASAARRRAILNDQKYPSVFITARYEEAQDTIVEYFTSKNREESIIIEKIGDLLNKKSKSAFELQKAQGCADALEFFYDNSDLLDIPAEAKITSGLSSYKKLKVQEVDVSVRPEIILRGENKKGKYIGAVKFYFSKTYELNDNSGEYIATIVHKYLDDNICTDEKCDLKYCYVFDVFNKKIYTAPKSFKRRRNDIDAACEEIKIRWDSI